MSGFNPTNRYVSPTDNIHRSGAEGVISVNVVGNMNEEANRTGNRLFQSVTESPRSSELVGTPFNFTTDIGGPLYRARTARLAAAVVPAIPNINRANNVVTMQFCCIRNFALLTNYTVLTRTFTIPVGYYTPSTFEDTFASLITDQFNSLIGQIIAFDQNNPIDTFTLDGFTDLTVTCVIDPLTFKMEINATAVNAVIEGSTFPGINFGFWIDNNSSFVQRGIHMVPFLGDDTVTENFITIINPQTSGLLPPTSL
jgi:hypothetical protein